MGYVVPVNDEHVFVMLADTWVWGGRREETPHERELREKYAKSGLYRRDNPAEPIWTFDGYAYREELRLTSDGVYMVICDGGHSDLPVTNGGAARRPELLQHRTIGFYANGTLIRGVKVAEVVSRPAEIPVSASRAGWLQAKRLDEAKHTFTVEAVDGTVTVFDIRTGEVIRQSGPLTLLQWAGIAVAGLVLVAVVVWLLRRYRPSARRAGTA